jgi:hypothetical protein
MEGSDLVTEEICPALNWTRTADPLSTGVVHSNIGLIIGLSAGSVILAVIGIVAVILKRLQMGGSDDYSCPESAPQGLATYESPMTLDNIMVDGLEQSSLWEPVMALESVCDSNLNE